MSKNVFYFTAYEGDQGAELERRRKNATSAFLVNPCTTMETRANKGNPLARITFCVVLDSEGTVKVGQSVCSEETEFSEEEQKEKALLDASQK